MGAKERALKFRPQPGWSLCEAERATETGRTGLVMARDLEGDTTTEGVFRVLRMTPQRLDKGGELHPGFEVGDLILVRGFLKHVNAIGDLVGADRRFRFCLVHNRDALAVVSGSGRLGFYSEYQVDEP